MRRTDMTSFRAALSVVLALLLGWASASEAGRGGGGRGGQGFHGGRGGGSHGGFQGGRGGRFHGDSRHRGDVRHPGFGHPGFRGRAFIGAGPLFWWGPGYFYNSPPVYYAPPPVYVQPEPIAYWYYCPSARAYYPYVATCPEAWIPVPAR